MAWDVEAKKVAIKVIGTVETGMKYDGINYRDPITVGMMQWYGTRAANILNLMRATPAWSGVASSLTDDLVANAETNGAFWTSRYLLRHEGDSLKPVLRSSTGKRIQHEKTLADLEDYKYQASRVYIDAETETNQFIFFCVMYHQSPKYARQIVNNAGLNPSLERLYTMAVNHSWYKSYKSRYLTAKNMIIARDYSGIPDFGVDPDADPDPTEEPEEGGDTSGTDVDNDGLTSVKGEIVSISLVGQSLHVKTKDGATTICHPTSTGALWVAGSEGQASSGVPIEPGTPVPDPVEPPTAPPATGGNAATKAAVVQFLVDRLEMYRYSQGAGRDKPDVSGVTDCSAIVAYAYLKVANIDIQGNTQSQYRKGTGIWSNLPGNGVRTAGASQPPDSVMQAGDLVYFARDTTWTRPRHVEMYMGNGRFIGWGGNTNSWPYPKKGPYIKSNSQSYMNYYKWITVRRLL